MMGERGRLVVPAEIRDRLDLRAGSPLVMVDTPQGIIVSTRDQVKRLVRANLQGLHLVDELLAERREAATVEGGP